MQSLRSTKNQAALSMIELLAGVAIVVVLLALVFPAVQRIRQHGKQTQCLANLRSYGNALLTFSAENQGLPWWNGLGSTQQTDGSRVPNFESWVRPYLHQTLANRLRCPNATVEQLKTNHRFNYAGNGALCLYYPRLVGLPVPTSRVVLAAENYTYESFNHSVHLNMTTWGIGESAAYGPGSNFAENEGIATQYHGTPNQRSLNLFFLDGHAEAISPPENDWRNPPTHGDATNNGYFYSRTQFKTLHTK